MKRQSLGAFSHAKSRSKFTQKGLIEEASQAYAEIAGKSVLGDESIKIRRLTQEQLADLFGCTYTTMPLALAPKIREGDLITITLNVDSAGKVGISFKPVVSSSKPSVSATAKATVTAQPLTMPEQNYKIFQNFFLKIKSFLTFLANLFFRVV